MGRHRLADTPARPAEDRREDRPARPGGGARVAGARVTGADVAAGSMHAIAPVLADALARQPGPARADDRPRTGRPVRRPRWTAARRVTAALGWAWVVVPFGWGLYELVAKIPALFG